MGGGTIEHVESRHEVSRAWCTVSTSTEILGYQDRTPLAAGLARMWEWAQDAWAKYPERRGSHERIAIEVDRGLYSFWK
jgi:hypothetical protein